MKEKEDEFYEMIAKGKAKEATKVKEEEDEPDYEVYDPDTAPESKESKPVSLSTKSKITTMRCGDIEKPIGPYSFGKIIEKPGVGKWAYTSGQVGTNAKGALVSKNPASQAK